MADEWCTLESDCGVFRALLQQNQVSGVDVVDVYDISGFAQESRQRGRLVLGYVLLLDKSKYQQTMSGGPVAAEPNRSIWFARQAVQNSCATHALLSIVMNLDLIKATLLDAAKRALAPAAVATNALLSSSAHSFTPARPSGTLPSASARSAAMAAR